MAIRSCQFCGEHLEELTATCCCCHADLVNNIPAAKPSISTNVVLEPCAPASRRDFYVYFHRDAKGQIFYVGKGTARRAWSTSDRDDNWKRYVADRSEGRHDVEIFRDGLSDAEAGELEWFLIDAHGHHLVNWINPGRQFDYAALDEYHRRRNKNRAFVADIRPLEKTDAELAITRYRQALKEMDSYEGLTLERGLLVELSGQRTCPDTGILDRLTLCLVKQGRGTEARGDAERFFVQYPAARQMTVGKRVAARVEKATSGRAGPPRD